MRAFKNMWKVTAVLLSMSMLCSAVWVAPVKADDVEMADYNILLGKMPTTNSSGKGHSNGVLPQEMEGIAPVPASGASDPSAEEELKNIALAKIPYVYGQDPDNIEAISDGTADGNYAVHNNLGSAYLQFEYKNTYKVHKINFKLEEGTYKSVKVSLSANPSNAGTAVFQESDWTQGSDMVSIALDAPMDAKDIRFTINKDNNSKVRYSEVEIWAEAGSYDESKPEYEAPDSKYSTLVWSDEFDGDAVDESKWNIIEGFVHNAVIYNRKAVSILKDGDESYLAINSRNYDTKQALVDAVGVDWYGNQNIENLDSKVTWSSGRVESKNKFSFQFGRMAVRAKVNDSQGIWPAIWMLCQDETGQDEIDVMEYLGQNPWEVWTTNHYGILNVNKGSQGTAHANYEAWSQDFHVFEVEWDPEQITWYLDGKKVFTANQQKGGSIDGMHTRPMFPILETQVGDDWVGPVDYNKQNTKQDSNFLVDWVRVYQTENQPVIKFDDLAALEPAETPDPGNYLIHPVSHTDGLIQLTDGNKVYEDKNNFFVGGGQPRYEKNRVAAGKNAGNQSLTYKVTRAKDVHLTTYYQTAGLTASIRSRLKNNAKLDFKIFTSPDGQNWTAFENMKIVENFKANIQGYARTTFDAYGLPDDTVYVKIQFPEYQGVTYQGDAGVMEVKNTDVQLAKAAFLQPKGADVNDRPEPPKPEVKISLDRADAVLHTSGDDQTVRLYAAVEGTDEKPVWSSSDPQTAQVDSDGLVTARKAGEAEITVSAAGESASCKVVVKETVVLTLDPASMELWLMDGEDTSGITVYVNGNKLDGSQARFESSSPGVVGVSTDGTVSAKGEGTAEITVRYKEKSAVCSVTVRKPMVKLNQSNASLYAQPGRDTLELSVSANGKAVPAGSVIWSSGNNDIAVVKDGKVTAKKAGTVDIRAVVYGISVQCRVNVAKSVLRLSRSKAVLYTSGKRTVSLKASLDGSVLSGKKIKWITSNSKKASVKYGKITAKSAGKVKITAITGGLKAVCTVTVRKPALTIRKKPTVMRKGKKYTLKVKTVPAAKVSFKSKDPKVVKVSRKGILNARKNGSAKITVKANGVSRSFTVKVLPR